MSVKKIMVVGAGQMGSGIAQVCAQAGFEVILNDIESAKVDKAVQQIEQLLARSVKKERITEAEKEKTLKQMTTTTRLIDGKEADLVIEAASENRDVKKDIFQKLDECMSTSAILATNTSSLPITEIAAVTKRPDKVIGMHFMNPVPVMKLVEIIRGLRTSDETYTVIEAITKQLKKISVEVNDYPGFAANRILMPMINEAIYTVFEGVASVEDVDTVMKTGMNHPMGPLELADFIGLDTCLSIMDVLYDGFSDSKYRPCPLLIKYVRAGRLGKKVGQGFYEYR